MLSLIAGPLGPFIGQIAIALLGWFLGRGQENSKSRQAFLDLVKTMQTEGSLPAGLRSKYIAQMKTDAEKAAAQYAKEHPNG